MLWEELEETYAPPSSALRLVLLQRLHGLHLVRCSTVSLGIVPVRLFIDDIPVTVDLRSISVVALVRSHKLDAAVALLVVVAVNKRRQLLACGLLAVESHRS